MTVNILKTQQGFLLRSELELGYPLETVFPFFAEAENLTRISPPFLSFSITSLSDKTMKKGLQIVYRIKLHGIPIRWTSLISRWEPPYCFVDEQIRGPYKSWRHLHTFERKGSNTIVKDEVNYSVFGGELAHSLFVKSDLQKIFSYRHEELKRIFANENGRHEKIA